MDYNGLLNSSQHIFLNVFIFSFWVSTFCESPIVHKNIHAWIFIQY